MGELLDELEGTVKFLFQSAEESGHGSNYYVDHGCFEDVDGAMAMHVMNEIPKGTVNIDDGPRMASSDRFVIKIHGKSAHGSAPDQGKDAIVAAAAVVMGLQTLSSRVNDPQNTFVLTVGMMNGGTQSNIIADEVELVGTTRAFDKAFRKSLPQLIEACAAKIAEGYGCRAECSYRFGPSPLINEHKDLNDIARKAASDIMGKDALVPMEKQMGAEDFSVYLETIPGLFAFLGARNRDKGIDCVHHHPAFDVDEDTFPDGSAIYARFAIDCLKN